MNRRFIAISFFLWLTIFNARLGAQGPAGEAPRQVVYGDTTARSFIEVKAEGLTRRIYLPTVVARQAEEDYYLLKLPDFGTAWNRLSHLEFELLKESYGGEAYWKVRLRESRFYPLDEVRLPRELGTFGRAVDSVAWGEESLFLTFQANGGAQDQDYLRGEFDVDQVIQPPQEPLIEGFFLDEDGERSELTEAEVTYQPAQRELMLRYGDQGTLKSVPLSRVSEGPGRYEEVNDYFGEYTHQDFVIDTLQPGKFVLRVYDFSALEDESPKDGNRFFNLDRGELVARLRTDHVFWLPDMEELILEPVE